jgi:ABC-type siderophore export system fused ATPase/permease subunit
MFCILLVTPDLFPNFSNSRVVSFCDVFIVSISILRSWMVLFISFAYLIVFSYKSLRVFVVVVVVLFLSL